MRMAFQSCKMPFTLQMLTVPKGAWTLGANFPNPVWEAGSEWREERQTPPLKL